MALIEIDGLPFLEMVDLSMAIAGNVNWQCHNQMVSMFHLHGFPSHFSWVITSDEFDDSPTTSMVH